ncbi:MAG: entericidin A/B family lipoprotein [Planctomycetota bacterium]
MLKKVFVMMSLAMFVSVLAACNTVEGVGEDVSAGGEALQDAASD